MNQAKNITAIDIIQTLFRPNDQVCLRVFADRKDSDDFRGMKLNVEAEKFPDIEGTLEEHNRKFRGIFFVVNAGGQTDAEITHINCQFVEIDDRSIEEQKRLIDEFPLPPSMVIQTRKSLHTYWLMKNAEVSRFRSIQRGLINHFGGDPACVNESRVMRLPGYYHCKKEPIMVRCISFHPERRYTQDELAYYLHEHEPADNKDERKEGTQKGLEIIEAACDFIKYCRDNARELSEPLWYALITNLADFEGGAGLIHSLSAPYPGYDPDETDKKIRHALTSRAGPITCKVISERGWKCPRMTAGTCKCKSPAAMRWTAPDVDIIQILLKREPVSGDVVTDFQAAMRFTDKYLRSVDSSLANMVIGHIIKDHYRLKTEDIRALLSRQRKLYREYQEKYEDRQRKIELGPLPEWYEAGKAGLIFLPSVLASHLADTEHVFYAAEQYYRYQDGVYKAISELEARNMVRLKMDERYTRLHQIVDAEGQWKLQIGQDLSMLNPNPYIINVRNGLYNVLEDTLESHTPEYLSTIQLNVSFKRGAQCPRFEQFLTESLEPDQIPLVQEMLGYFLVPINRAQKSFVIVGAGGAGKSKLLMVINDVLLGRNNVSNISWQALGERFQTAELVGKLANIFADLPTKGVEDTGVFKALVGEDFITVERKNRDPFSFISTARLLFSCNSIPRNFNDRSSGFYRRLIIIRFSHPVPEERRDPYLLDKFREESEGIFLYALEGLKRLMANNYSFSETEANRQELQKYMEDSNSVLAFVRDCCDIGVEYECGRTETYDRYKNYCTESGLQPYSQRTFNAELETNMPGVTRAVDRLGKRKTWRGMKLADVFDGFG